MRLYGAAMILVGLVMVATSAIGTAVLLVLIGAALALLPDVSLAQAVRRNARLNPGPTTIELTDERLRSANSMASTDVAWSAVNRATENDEFWFLRLVSKQAIILPKQHFTPQQQDELRAFLAGRGLAPAKG
jgi:hypothetical protein